MSIGYWLAYAPAKLLGYLPLSVLHLIADGIAKIGYHLLRYRRKVARENLCQAFPEKSEKEIIAYEKRFYSHFLRQLFESFKLLTFSKEEAARHISFSGIDIIDELREEGCPVVFLMMGHYGNWEYFTAAPLHIKSLGYDLHQIYRPLKNKSIDRLMKVMREQYGAYSIAKEDVGRSVISLKRNPREGQTALIIFIADQTPSKRNIHYFASFLNRPSAFFTGAERLAAKLDIPIVYMDVRCTGKGHYHGELSMLSRHPAKEPFGLITERFAEKLEQTIRQDPPYWLWSHRRWKHNIEDYPNIPRSAKL
ncbi:acyltransferase, HtrB/MsbB family [Porphyromonas crevioricanis JCM 15906]|uniref:Acyltransferase, HtrB/MsbB family n=1 Tax=Porphyromonas crevioricanis JCM 15906 TaxID=1305617 RepID=T1DSE9_9PORP|nr:lysophospholipid acyltransferase family protein [Porphyromonas crevioricanis]GAD05234.1 acyltransferase, HtrB/MsbB family [Porphyromonas crevioricanis JCM 15906]SKA01527.1 KDO2-lipid IV(A) lauroyltransferase [Porphyromonas crevioricanis]